jgi:glycosyltransferase involved in cell wall biosynthesis
MLHGKTVAVVVPCYNEETQIGMVIESMPDFVDRIVIVNDKSTDKTKEVVLNYIEKDNTARVALKRFPNKVIPTKYNEADQVVEEMNSNFKKLI